MKFPRCHRICRVYKIPVPRLTGMKIEITILLVILAVLACGVQDGWVQDKQSFVSFHYRVFVNWFNRKFVTLPGAR